MGSLKKIVQATEKRYAKDKATHEKTVRRLNKKPLADSNSKFQIQRRLEELSLSESWIESYAHPISTVRATTDVNDPISAVDALSLERVLGTNDLVTVSYLEEGLRVSRSVGRIRNRNRHRQTVGYGTGFMLSPQLIVTNHHVLSTKASASMALMEFGYRLDWAGNPLPTTTFHLDPERFFLANAPLDYCVCAIGSKESGEASVSDLSYCQLPHQPLEILKGEFVSIIQHPGGEPLQLAIRENRVIDRPDPWLLYKTDTAPGSSGSPVFDDQWTLVALHHSGVPDKDKDGNWLATDGSIWNESMGEHRIKWIANEGARAFEIAKSLRERVEGRNQRSLLDEAITSPDGLGSTLPLVHVGGASDAASDSETETETETEGIERELESLLAQAVERRQRPYYDAEADGQARDTYYRNIDFAGTADDLTRSLHRMIRSTHTIPLSYRPSRHLYPWVDQQPEWNLQSIYSGDRFATERIIREDLRVERMLARNIQRAMEQRSLDGRALAERLDEIERSLSFNCEHVVPQSWFRKRQPMKGDLHHLFTCEKRCNSFRSNFPYFDFADDRSVMEHCGRRESDGFEPRMGKGAAARATFYFLLRYPEEVNSQEMPSAAIDTLVQWNEAAPVSEYERHRNSAIQEMQGNRNPLIDFPQLAGRLAFEITNVH